MATTVGDIIRGAMRKVGILAAGEPLPPEDGADAIGTFERMVDAWTNETLLIPTVNVVTKLLFAGQGEYTIGIFPEPVPNPLPLTHIETARPERILASFIRDRFGTDYILEIIEVETYSRISRKVNTSRPSRFYLRKGWPLNTILFEALPFADETLHLEVVQPLSEILKTAEPTDVIDLPPGYKRALEYNLALDLAPEWGKDPSSVVVVTAVEAKKWLKRQNYRSLVLGMDRAVATQRKGIGIYIIEQGP